MLKSSESTSNKLELKEAKGKKMDEDSNDWHSTTKNQEDDKGAIVSAVLKYFQELT